MAHRPSAAPGARDVHLMYAHTCSAPPASGGEELGAGVQLAGSHGCAPLPLGAKALEVQEWQDFKEFGQAGHKPGQGPAPEGNQGAHSKNTRADGHLHASQSFQRVRICSSLRHQPRNSLGTETPPKSICKNGASPQLGAIPSYSDTYLLVLGVVPPPAQLARVPGELPNTSDAH